VNVAIDWDKLVIGPTVEEFGVSVRYTALGETFPVTGVFDEEYLSLTPLGRGDDGTESLSLGSPGAISTERPVLGVQLSAFKVPPAQGDRLVIDGGPHRGERFEVKEVRPDGHGSAKLLLNADGE
jgi:hypothetical protein